MIEYIAFYFIPNILNQCNLLKQIFFGNSVHLFLKFCYNIVNYQLKTKNIYNIKYCSMSQIEYVHDVDESFNENPDRRPYGKMKVICNNKYCKIVIGPDCIISFS